MVIFVKKYRLKPLIWITNFQKELGKSKEEENENR